MTPYQRLLAEEFPTGTFGYPLRPGPRPTPPAPPWTPEQQAQHVADLLAALNGWHDPDEHATRKRERHHHLRLIHDHTQTPDAA